MNDAVIKIILKTYEDICEHYKEIRRIAEKQGFEHRDPDKIERYIRKKQKLIDRIDSKHKLADSLWIKLGVTETESDYDKALRIGDESSEAELLKLFEEISSEILVIRELEDKKMEIISGIQQETAKELSVLKNKSLIKRYNMPKSIMPGTFIDKKKGVH